VGGGEEGKSMVVCVGSNNAFTAEIFQIKPSTNPEREGENNCPQKLKGEAKAQAFSFCN